MKLTKQDLVEILKEELEGLMEGGIPGVRPSRGIAQGGADLHKILYEISQEMEDKGIYEPKAGIEEWLKDPDNTERVSEEDIQALYEMSDEIYDYM